VTPEAHDRRRWREHFESCAAVASRFHAVQARYIATGGRSPAPIDPTYPAFPDDLRDMRCGARTRLGGACKRRDLMLNGRCRLHGGMSTGPKTSEGKARASANLCLRWRSEPREDLMKPDFGRAEDARL
jgi:hypothetical protein